MLTLKSPKEVLQGAGLRTALQDVQTEIKILSQTQNKLHDICIICNCDCIGKETLAGVETRKLKETTILSLVIFSQKDNTTQQRPGTIPQKWAYAIESSPNLHRIPITSPKP
eukprot:12119021-Ditylum_brightwellii.AAC.1